MPLLGRWAHPTAHTTYLVPDSAERSFFFRTPLDYLFTFSCFAAAAAAFGLAGIFSQQPTLVTIFFA